MDSTSDITGAPNFIVASGGTETNSPCGDYKIHTFTSDGTFTMFCKCRYACNSIMLII
jgi:hypothetical protein